MKLFARLVALIMIFSACNSDKKSTEADQSVLHKVIVQEVMHVKEYSYMRVLEDGKEFWVAAPITPVNIGQTYYFGKTMEMKNFESKELGKTFETVLFIEKLSTDPDGTAIHKTLETPNQASPNTQQATKPVIEKAAVNVDAPADGISIAELFENKEKYEGQLVKLSGTVTKYNPAIMGVNWLHMQDGTDFNGEFDLTVTTKEEVQIGETVILQGKVTLNKDFGAGYFYGIIVEGATLIK